MDKDYKANTIIAMMVAAVAASGLTYLGTAKKGSGKAPGEISSLLEECVDILKEKGVANFDNDEAINGYLKAGGDQWAERIASYDLAPDKFTTKDMNASGTLTASGFTIDKSDDGNILVTDVISGMAADKCGLRAGDIITHIDGTSISDEGYSNSARLLLGKQDTTAELTIERSGKAQNITFKRDNDAQLFYDSKVIDNILYVQIEAMAGMVEGYLDQSINDNPDVKGYIIDLRNSIGGETDIGVRCADKFVGANKVVLKSFTGDTETLVTEAKGDEITKPVVVLVNGETYSASETLTALLKQGADCTIVGEKTFGKGVFQREETLSDGSRLHYTAGTFTVGDWKNWNGVGISPDVEVEMDSQLIGTDDDIQLKKAIDLLS